MIDNQQSVVFDAYPKVSLTQFVPEIAYEFSEMPEEIIPHYVLRAVNKIARDGNVLRRFATIHTQDCVKNYLLEAQDCTEVVAIMDVCNICGNTSSVVRRFTQQPCYLSCGTMSWFEFPNTIFFDPPRTGNSYRVQMSVAPTYEACEVDKILLTKYYDTIMAGVRASLYAITGKPWSSVNRALEYEQRFNKGISSAAIETMVGGQRGVIRTKRQRPL